MRAAIIFAGTSLISRFHWVMYIFGAFLIYSGIKMFGNSQHQINTENNVVIKTFKRFFPFVDRYENGYFFIKNNGRYVATLLFIVLIMVEFTDLIFATDSIPAILAISTD